MKNRKDPGPTTSKKGVRRRLLRWLGAIAVLAIIPSAFAHVRGTGTSDASTRAAGMLRHQFYLIDRAETRDRTVNNLRRGNPEWDLMTRMFVVLALTNQALREPNDKKRALAAADLIIDETIAQERAHGHLWYLLPYAESNPFINRPGRSLFVDGEIAMMVAARQTVEERPALRSELRERVRLVLAAMAEAPILSAESYPDECWTFCNTVGLAAVRMADRAQGTDHSDFAKRWVAVARERLIDEDTGLLVSSFTRTGTHLDGPEGSTIWMAAHNLLLVDEAFAREQYELARKHLGIRVMGYQFAREWPAGGIARLDIDSGPVIPGLGAGAASSGLMIVGANAFGDRARLDGLLSSLDLAAAPTENEGRLSYALAGPMGDAVILYGLTQGPLWAKVRNRRQ